MRMDQTQLFGLRISASKSASPIKKRTTFDPPKIILRMWEAYWDLINRDLSKKNGSRDLVLGTLGPQ